jgi:hypothetical protein
VAATASAPAGAAVTLLPSRAIPRVRGAPDTAFVDYRPTSVRGTVRNATNARVVNGGFAAALTGGEQRSSAHAKADPSWPRPTRTAPAVRIHVLDGAFVETYGPTRTGSK